MSTCSPLTSWYSSTSTWSNDAASRGPITSSRGERAPEQQQVVEVDHAERPLARRVGLEQRRDRLAVLRAPREVLLDHARQRLLRVDRARVDVQQRALAREPRLAPARARAPRAAGPARPPRRPRRARRSPPGSPSADGVAAHEPVRDRVERPAEHARRRRHEPARPLQHLARRPARERQQQDPLRRHALAHQPRDPRAQRRRLARARPGEDQQRPAGVRRGRPLLVVELVEPGPLLDLAPRPPWPTDATDGLGRLPILRISQRHCDRRG